MPLTIKFSDLTKNNITIPDMPPGVNAVDTSLSLVGRGYPNYGQKFAENFLHLLENFASPIPPENPIEGQLWYDTSDIGNKVLRIMDGTAGAVRWPSANGLYQQSTDPKSSPSAGLKTGDIWVDTKNNQVKIYSAGAWTLIGPSATNLTVDSSGKLIATDNTTGSLPTVEKDNLVNSNDHNVIEEYVSGRVVAVISQDAFTPKQSIPGYGTSPIVRGINLPSGAILNGAADRSLALVVNNERLSASTFLRKDDNSTTGQIITGKLTLQNESYGGLYLSSNMDPYSSQLSFVDHKLMLSNSTPTGVISLAINDTDMIVLDNVGVTVESNLIVSGDLTVSMLTAADGISTDVDLVVGGNITNAGKIFSGDDVNVGGQLYVNWNNGQAGPAILPGISGEPLSNTYDIGSPTAEFRAIYARTIGSPTSRILGTVEGAAVRLSNFTPFRISGQLESTGSYKFNGDGNIYDQLDVVSANGTIDVKLTPAAMYEQPVAESATSGMSLLAYDSDSNALFQLMNNIFVPGMIMPYGGDTPPEGWLLCNGITISTTTYSALFGVVGYRYGGSGNLFAVPDMRHSTKAEETVINYIIRA
jgi:hypothetical protein